MNDARQMVGDYGIDSPVAVRGLGYGAAAALLVTVVSGIIGVVSVMAAAFGVALVVSLFGLVLVRSSRVHKLRERVRTVDLLRLQGDERVLDVGCGRGLLLVEVARRLNDRGRAFGVDRWPTVDDAVIDADAAIHNAHLEGVDHQLDVISADARSLPYADDSFNAVVSGLALHHIEGFDSRVHAIREIARVLMPGGRVVLIDRHHTTGYADALRASNLVAVRRSRRIWRLLPPARYVTAAKPAEASSIPTPVEVPVEQTKPVETPLPMVVPDPIPGSDVPMSDDHPDDADRPLDGQLELTDVVTGERDGSGHEAAHEAAENGPSM